MAATAAARPMNGGPTPRAVVAPAGARETMAARLAAWRVKTAEVPEIDLIRDILYILQGIDGHYVKFDEPSRSLPPALAKAGEAEPGIKISAADGARISQPTQDLLHQLAELGWLFRKIERGIKARAGSAQRGMVEQSLCHSLEAELESYYKLLAILEARAARPITSLSDTPDDPPSERLQLSLGLDETAGLTLKRLAVWTQEARLKLRMMGVLVDGCETSHGGALVSLLHSYTSHGDPFVRNFTDGLLLQVSKPFFRTLAKWIYDGELVDPLDEFFVQLNPDVKEAVEAAQRRQAEAESMGYSSAVEDASGLRLWERKFLFRREMLPTFVSPSFAEKIFLTGKSLNFIKSSCGDAEWVAEHQKQHSAGKVLGYGDIAGLERTIDSAYSAASQRLFEIFFGKLRLLDHLRALKDYLLLGRGDFFEVLIEGMAPFLARPASNLHRHQLTLMLETAMRGSSASTTDEEISKRLDARMLDFSNTDIAWDVFTIEYKVDAPVDTVIDSGCLDKYLRVFQHLWRMKRVEVSANSAWRRVMTDARTFARVSSLDQDFHRARLTLSDMVHFVRQLQYFCHLDVIEVSWAKLEEACSKKEGDLDTLIKVHRQTLRTIRNQTLLLQPSKPGREEALLHHIRDAFDLILQFRETVDALCNFALAEASRQAAAGDADRGVQYVGSDSPKLNKADVELRDNIRKRLNTTAKRFEDTVLGLILNVSVHGDQDVRLLATRLDFSGSRRRQRK